MNTGFERVVAKIGNIFVPVRDFADDPGLPTTLECAGLGLSVFHPP